MVQQQVESYNRFIRMGMQKIVDSNNMVEPEVSDFAIKFIGDEGRAANNNRIGQLHKKDNA